MAEEISDERFKTEMMRLMHNAIGRFSDMDNRFDIIAEQLGTLSSDVRTLTGQLNDIGVLAIKDSERDDNLEKRVDDLESNIH